MALRPRSPKPADGEQINFYERMIARFGQPVLELASGTGNYLVTLSENDFDIAGTEKFDARFNISREKAKRRNVENNLHSADMRDFNLDQKFKLIFIAGNALQHLKTNAEVASCFASVKRHLAPGGKFIVEIFNPSVALLNRHPNERFFVGEYRTDDGWIVIHTTVNYVAAKQINHVNWHYKNQYHKEEQTVSFTMRQFFPQELDALFEYNGFHIEAKHVDFDESDFNANSPKQIIVARPK
ncbi:MAG: class I SAM-dependent methyltransferase [Acidobacteriota bacterium]